MSVREAQQRISSEEFTLWLAYSVLEPFGYPWQRFLMSVPATVIANEIRASVPRGKNSPPVRWFKAEDFYPRGESKGMPSDLTPQQRAFIESRKAKRAKAKAKGK